MMVRQLWKRARLILPAILLGFFVLSLLAAMLSQQQKAPHIFWDETKTIRPVDDHRHSSKREYDEDNQSAPVPCVPPYCSFRCAGYRSSPIVSSIPHPEIPSHITCTIGTVTQTFHNIVFGIPEQEIVECVPEKAFDFAFIVPGDLRTYVFGSNEYEYKRNYRESYFSYTKMKGGWDCMRHYEILASGSMPYFTDLHDAPNTVMSLLPKALIKEGMRIRGVNATHIDHTLFDHDAYLRIARQTLEYTRRYLSSKAIARYVLEVMRKPHARRVLLLSHKPIPDYMRDMLVHGMRELLGSGAVDVPGFDFMYEYPKGIPPMGLQTESLYGKGFSYAHRMPVMNIDRENLTARIAAREFDVIIYGCTEGDFPYVDDVLANYDPSSIAVVNGEDWQGWTRIEDSEHPQHKLLGKAVHFVRELPDICPERGEA